MTRASLRGQMLILALLILAALMASIPLLITMASHLQKTLIQVKSTWEVDETAKAAFGQVSATLESNPDAWERAMKGETLSILGYDGEFHFQGLHQIPYSVTCIRDLSMPPDTLKITVTAFTAERSAQRSRRYQAIFSHGTMGIDVPDVGHAPAALYALNDIDAASQGADPPSLDVHWGSIVCFGSLSLGREQGENVWGRHPRTFCRSGFFPPTPVSGNTDHKAYWVGFPMGDPVTIDEDKYKEAAQMQDVEQAIIGKDAAGGYALEPDQGIVFQSVGKPVASEIAPIFFIDGSVLFRSKGIDLGFGAMVVERNATFARHTPERPMNLHVPARAGREYPYLLSGQTFPCSNNLGALCSSEEALDREKSVDFRGFLYVKGDLFIKDDTVIAGVVRVDGRLTIASGKRLTIFFDDNVSRTIFLVGAPILQQLISQPP